VCPREDERRPDDARAVQSFTGELVGASEEEITLAADGGVIAIPYSENPPIQPGRGVARDCHAKSSRPCTRSRARRESSPRS